MGCRGYCEKYKQQRLVPTYLNGQKRCRTCEYFIVTNNIYCDCCGKKYRTKPKVKRYTHLIS